MYDSAHFAPFAQPSDDATRALNRVTIEPSVAGFAQEVRCGAMSRVMLRKVNNGGNSRQTLH